MVKALTYTNIPTTSFVQHGDLVFVDTRCGPMCDAITAVTSSKYELSLSHVGIFAISEQDSFIVEATGAGVVTTSWADFKAKHNKELFVGRMKAPFNTKSYLDKVVQFCVAQLGKSYDDFFVMDSEMYYCSELIYEATKSANNDVDVFELHPMTFKKPNSNKFDKGWKQYFKKLNIPIPEGELGINPGGMTLSPHLDFYLLTNKAL